MRKTVFNTLKAPVQAYSVLTVNKPLQVAIAPKCWESLPTEYSYVLLIFRSQEAHRLKSTGQLANCIACMLASRHKGQKRDPSYKAGCACT